MKLLHSSDWYLGQNFMGKSRADEHEAFLFWLLNIIKEKQVEVLLVSGDIFDTGTPPNYDLELYYNFLKELSNIKTLITTIITAGNYDSVSTLKAPKQLLEVLNVHVITTGDEDENVIIPINKNDDLISIVCAVPFLRDSVIRESLSGITISEKEKLTNSGIKAYYEHNYLLKEYGIVQSMSRKGNCHDNAVAESFFHTLKTELINHEIYHTKEQAKRSIFEYIEVFYNRERLHSSNDNLSPVEFEEKQKLLQKEMVA